MYCTHCGNVLKNTSDAFCASCGTPQQAQNTQQQAPPVVQPAGAPNYFEPQQTVSRRNNSGFGVGLTGLIFGAAGLMFALYDLAGVSTSYDYVYAEEIGLLFMMSVVALVLGGVGMRFRSRVAIAALSVGAFTMLLTLILASISAPYY